MQDSNIAISAENLSKCFHIYKKMPDRIKQALWCGKKQYYEEFWALKNVNFSVKHGESFAIIGRNGSGKSTLLQLICKTLTATTGRVHVQGRIAALLELGAGFSPEFTGRENVYINGAILGFTRDEINATLDEILAFADIGSFVDQPIKTYSSGMFVRLAFAVQAFLQPDVLIIDEALSVGDIFFQQKCAKRMQYLRDQGTTLIFVSHDMGAVRDLCENAVLLQAGQMVYCGSSIEAIRLFHGENTASISINKSQSLVNNLNSSAMSQVEQFKKTALWVASAHHDNKIREAKIIAIAVLSSDNITTMKVQMGEKLILRILYQSYTTEPIHIAVALRNRYDHVVNSSGTYTQNLTPPKLKIGSFSICELEIDCMLEAGSYTFCAFLASEAPQPNRAQAIDESLWLGPLIISWDYENRKAPWLGMFGLPVNVKIVEIEATNL